MTQSTFIDEIRSFTKSQSANKKNASVVDWNERRQVWLTQLNNLLNDVEQWLKPLCEDGTLSLERQPRHLAERETLGDYQAVAMVIYINGQTIFLEPVGSIIIGAFGRVDMKGPFADFMLLLATSDDQDLNPIIHKATWHISTRRNRRRLLSLNADTFGDAFQICLGMGE